MASNLFVKRDCAVRFRLRSAAALATSAKREVPRANGRAAAGSAAVFYVASCSLENTISADGLLCFPYRLRYRDDRCDATVFCVRFIRIRRVGERVHSRIIIIIMRAGRQGQCDFVQTARRFFHFVNPRIPIRKRACKVYLLMRICAADKSYDVFR